MCFPLAHKETGHRMSALAHDGGQGRSERSFSGTPSATSRTARAARSAAFDRALGLLGRSGALG
jgi:hypothetical protein